MLSLFFWPTMSREPEKPTVKMPATPLKREDSLPPRHMSEDEKDLAHEDGMTLAIYRELKGYIHNTNERARLNQLVEVARIEEQASLEAKHVARYDAIFARIERMSSDTRHEFVKKIRIIDEKVDAVSEYANEAFSLASANTKDIRRLDARIETLEEERIRLQKRSEFFAVQGADGSPLEDPWDMGEVTQNGTHRLIPVAQLEASRATLGKKVDEVLELRTTASDARKWTSLVKWMIGVVGVVFTVTLTVVIQHALNAAPHTEVKP
jgi:hypothetical protein